MHRQHGLDIISCIIEDHSVSVLSSSTGGDGFDLDALHDRLLNSAGLVFEDVLEGTSVYARERSSGTCTHIYG